MDWLVAMSLGACGGAIVQAVALSANVQAWQTGRHQAYAAGQPLPDLLSYVDPVADSLVLLTRLVLGALAGVLFHSQVSGATAAIAVGASAPALLRQLGTARSLADGSAPEGTVPKVVTSKSVVDQDYVPGEDG